MVMQAIFLRRKNTRLIAQLQLDAQTLSGCDKLVGVGAHQHMPGALPFGPHMAQKAALRQQVFHQWLSQWR